MKTRKVSCVLLGMMMIASTVACESTEETVETDYDVWSKESYVKVLADTEYDETFRRPLSFEVNACQNEYEATQLIITANSGNVGSYEVEINDLVNAKGEVFAKENIAVYHEKYINAYTVGESIETGPGWYPDAMLPYEKAVEYGENIVEEGKNQAIYLEVYVPANTTPGVYSGNFTLIVDGTEHNVPAKLNVYDYTVTSETHLGGNFSWHATKMVVGEKNNTREMKQKYVEAILSFRLSTDNGYGFTLQDWIEFIRVYCNPDKTPLQAVMGTIPVPVEQKGNGVNASLMRERLVILAAASVVDGVDYLQYAVTRLGFIDEPHMKGTFDLVNSVCSSFNAARDALAADLQSGVAVGEVKAAIEEYVQETLTDEEFESKYAIMKDSIVESTYKFANTVTSYQDSRFTDDVNSFSPSRTGTDTAKERDYYYNLERAQWWYTCGGSQNVFGYAIGVPLLEPRLVAWASYDYDFAGEIYWEMTQYVKKDVESRNTIAVNPYEEAIRSDDDAGDGFFFYPGKQYGIDGPVASLRLHALRDGREDYELFYDLDQKYSEHGYSPRAILSVLFKSLYQDTTLTVNSAELFADARETVIELISLAEKGVFFTDYYELATNAHTTINCVGDVKVSKINGASQDLHTDSYKATTSLSNAKNTLALKFSDGTEFDLFLGDKTTILKTFTNASELNVVSGVELSNETVDGVQGVKVTMSSVEFGAPNVNTAVDASSISKATRSISIRTYNPNTEKVYMNVYLIGSGGMAFVGDCVLYPGWNTSKINIKHTCAWQNVRKLEKVQFEFTLAGGEDFADYEGITLAYIAKTE